VSLKRGIFKSLTKSLENVTEMGTKAVTDKDQLNKIQGELATLRTTLMMTGSGASITKLTICALVTWVVGVVSWIFLKNPANMVHAKDFALVVGTVMGLITGGFVSGTSLKRRFEKNK